MLRRAWKPVALATGIGVPVVGGYYYFAPRAQTFDLAIRTRDKDGQVRKVMKTLPLLPSDQVNAKIREHAQSLTEQRPGITWHHSTAYLPSNDPIEDASAHAIVKRDPTDPSVGDLLFFAVMDGHSGFETSRLLSKTLINAVTLELSKIIGRTASTAEYIRSWIGLGPPPTDSDPKAVSSSIRKAFLELDQHLIYNPLQLILSNVDIKKWKKGDPLPDLRQHPRAQSVAPAVSGSCALLALVDTAHENLYVACTGDSRAVAGIWNEENKSWRVEVLSEDQTGRNPKELKRMQDEHPKEKDDVIRNGRVLGGLEPTRAFGDARYKWSKDMQGIIGSVFFNDSLRPPPASFKTPPYVTSEPEVSHRKLSLRSNGRNPSESLRFLVLATDGLWDELSSDEVVGLVGGYLAGIKGNVEKSELPKLVPTTTGAQTVSGKDLRTEKTDLKGSWAFVDDNISTHLIRNAVGGGDDLEVRKLLSIPAPHSRRYRDDITVTCVWWEPSSAAAASNEDSSNTTVKAKL